MKLPRHFASLVLAAFLAGWSLTSLWGGSFTAAVETIHQKGLRHHCEVLASDALEGRETGTRGGQAAGAYIVGVLRKQKIRPAGTDGDYYQLFPPNSRNILAAIRGSDPALRNEYVVVGAHYDHVGYGSSRNSRGPIGYIHNGADDNASGASALLELVDAFSSLDTPLRRSILFAFWDAEENGLLGSQYWMGVPTVPLEQIRLAVNIDMIGRLRQNRAEVFGSRTAAGLRELVARQNSERSVGLSFLWETRRDSDHYSFFTHRIPYLMIFTGKHPEYHTPYDDVDKLEVDGMERLTRLLFRTAYAAAQMPALPEFRNSAFQEGSQGQLDAERTTPNFPPRLGITWDEGWARSGVIQIVDVDPGSPAALGGLQPGDRLLDIDGIKIDSPNRLRGAVFSARNKARVLLQRPQASSPSTVEVALPPLSDASGLSCRLDQAEPGCGIVDGVLPGSPAEDAGLKVGDRIQSVGRRSFSSLTELNALVLKEKRIAIEFERDGQEHAARLIPRAPSIPQGGPR